MLLGAALGGVARGPASVSFDRTDVALPAAPDSVALGDFDGVHGKDIVVALWSPGSVGVMLNNGDGTFAAIQQYTAGPECAGLAVDITLGDVTSRAGQPPCPTASSTPTSPARRTSCGSRATARARWATRRRSTSASRRTSAPGRATCSR